MLSIWVVLGLMATAGGGYIAYRWSKTAAAPSGDPVEKPEAGSRYEHGAEQAPVRTGPAPRIGYNPLRATKGSRIMVNDGDIAGVVFGVSEIEAFVEEVDGRSYPFTDYCIVSQNPERDNAFASEGDGRIFLRLRVVRQEHDVLGAKPEFIVYSVHESRAFDAGWIKEQIRDTKGILRLTDVMPEEPIAEFTCCDPTPDPHEVQRTWFKDDDGNGALDDSEAQKGTAEYWVFERTVSYEGEEFPQYAIVQVNQSTGNIDVLVGYQVSPEAVNVS